MTLKDIIKSALSQCGREKNAQNVEKYRVRFTELANEAQSDIALAIGFTREEAITPYRGLITISSLSHRYRRAITVYQMGHEVRFIKTNDGIIALPYDTTERFEVSPRGCRNIFLSMYEAGKAALRRENLNG